MILNSYYIKNVYKRKIQKYITMTFPIGIPLIIVVEHGGARCGAQWSMGNPYIVLISRCVV